MQVHTYSCSRSLVHVMMREDILMFDALQMLATCNWQLCLTLPQTQHPANEHKDT